MTNKDKSDKRGELAGQVDLGGRRPWERGAPRKQRSPEEEAERNEGRKDPERRMKQGRK